MESEAWRQRREEMIREAQTRALAREARKVGEAFAATGTRPAGFGVRWGLAEDEAAVADLLQLNGMPRWVAFEERFIVAENGGRIVGALRYRTESKRLDLGLLVVDPWAGERRTARALYAGSRDLARELGVAEIFAARSVRAKYPALAGYRRAGRGWYSPAARAGEDAPTEALAEDRRSSIRSLVARVLPFHRAFRG